MILMSYIVVHFFIWNKYFTRRKLFIGLQPTKTRAKLDSSRGRSTNILRVLPERVRISKSHLGPPPREQVKKSQVTVV